MEMAVVYGKLAIQKPRLTPRRGFLFDLAHPNAAGECDLLPMRSMSQQRHDSAGPHATKTKAAVIAAIKKWARAIHGAAEPQPSEGRSTKVHQFTRVRIVARRDKMGGW
jgi:hypothetical protein